MLTANGDAKLCLHVPIEPNAVSSVELHQRHSEVPAGAAAKVRELFLIDWAPESSCGTVDRKIENVVVMQFARRRARGIDFVKWRRQHEWYPAFSDTAVRA